MKFCTKCGTQLKDDDAFCTNCGNPLSQSQPQQNPKASIQQRKENKTSKALFTIGIFIFVFGSIGSIIIGFETDNDIVAIVSSVACFISGMCFIGFSEIIKLLQENIYQQNTMIQFLNNQTTKDNSRQE